jgi:ferredoxin
MSEMNKMMTPKTKPNENAVIRDANGKKICSIQCPQKIRDYFIPREIQPYGFLVLLRYNRHVWSNPDAVVLWAWYQAISAVDDVRQQHMPTRCVVCQQMSIELVYYGQSWYLALGTLLNLNDKPNGMMCRNSHCPMFKVVIPLKIFSVSKNDVPSDVLERLNALYYPLRIE